MKRAARLERLNPGGTVFAEYTALANKHKAVNLGQGFPSLPVGDFIQNAAINAINGNFHQYTRSEGHPRLCHAISKFYAPQLNRTLDPMTEIVTTVGASEAISSIIQAFIDPGDEVLLIQPFYDSYPASVYLAGGIPRCVSLHPTTSSDWKLDIDELEAKVSSKTKLLILNNPNNPVGKVYSRKELQEIASFCEKHDLLVIADEVYETLTYESEMIKFASLPNMFQRTLTIGSIGKMFGVTGWKIGWLFGPKDLCRACWMVHQFVPFAVCSPLQEAAAESIEIAINNDYFKKTRALYKNLRDLLYNSLESLGLNPMKPEGGYFIVSDMKHLDINQDISKFLTEKVGVTTIPVRAFYQKEDYKAVDKLVRFAFCKDEETLKEGIKRLETFFFNKK